MCTNWQCFLAKVSVRLTSDGNGFDSGKMNSATDTTTSTSSSNSSSNSSPTGVISSGTKDAHPRDIQPKKSSSNNSTTDSEQASANIAAQLQEVLNQKKMVCKSVCFSVFPGELLPSSFLRLIVFPLQVLLAFPRVARQANLCFSMLTSQWHGQSDKHFLFLN